MVEKKKATEEVAEDSYELSPEMKEIVDTVISEHATKDVEENSYEALSPEMKAIFDEAAEIEAEISKEHEKKSARAVAQLAAYFKLAKKTSINIDQIMLKATTLREGVNEGTEIEQFEKAGSNVYEVVELIVGKEKAEKMLEEFDGAKLALAIPLQTAFNLAQIKKAS